MQEKFSTDIFIKTLFMKKLLMLILGSLVIFAASAQDESESQRGFDRNKLFFGGYFAMSFGNSTFVNISPQVGYRFNRYLAAGTGINAQYSSFRTNYSDGSSTREDYGVVGLNIFGRVYPIQQILVQLQPELNYTWGTYKVRVPGIPESKSQLDGKFIPSLLAGAGAAIPAGRGSFLIVAQYDVLQNARTPYGNHIFFSFGFNTGF
jgi:hypothetical protein